jgi:hypothetical protein
VQKQLFSFMEYSSALLRTAVFILPSASYKRFLQHFPQNLETASYGEAQDTDGIS